MTSRLETVAHETMDLFWTHLENGHLNQSIATLRTLGYAAAAIDFALEKESYYVPVHVGSRLIRPKNVSDETIPVVALERGTTYEFELPVMHALQRDALQRYDIDEETVQQAFSASNHGEISSVIGGSNDASVYRRLITPADTALQIESRPTVTFDYDATKAKLPPICTSAVMHELVHVAQSLTDPLWQDGALAKKELEAYAVQAQLVHSYHVPYSTNTAMAGHVDMYRKRYLGDDGYEPTQDFEEYARYDGALSKALKIK